MRAASLQNAKVPQVAFEADGAEKRRGLTPEIQAAVEEWMATVFERLKGA